MSGIGAITLIVANPSAVARRLTAAFRWETTADYGSFAEVSTGNGLTVWLNAPSEPTPLTQQGVVLHYTVENVTASTERARETGAEVLREPTKMDFGLESAMVRVEGGPIVDLTKPLSD